MFRKALKGFWCLQWIGRESKTQQEKERLKERKKERKNELMKERKKERRKEKSNIYFWKPIYIIGKCQKKI